jgi:hypothetical protein
MNKQTLHAGIKKYLGLFSDNHAAAPKAIEDYIAEQKAKMV